MLRGTIRRNAKIYLFVKQDCDNGQAVPLRRAQHHSRHKTLILLGTDTERNATSQSLEEYVFIYGYFQLSSVFLEPHPVFHLTGSLMIESGGFRHFYAWNSYALQASQARVC